MLKDGPGQRLIDERNQWRKDFERGEKPNWPPLNEYKENRESGYWRSSKIAERFHEYVLYLEAQNEKLKAELRNKRQEDYMYYDYDNK